MEVLVKFNISFSSINPPFNSSARSTEFFTWCLVLPMSGLSKSARARDVS